MIKIMLNTITEAELNSNLNKDQQDQYIEWFNSLVNAPYRDVAKIDPIIVIKSPRGPYLVYGYYYRNPNQGLWHKITHCAECLDNRTPGTVIENIYIPLDLRIPYRTLHYIADLQTMTPNLLPIAPGIPPYPGDNEIKMNIADLETVTHFLPPIAPGFSRAPGDPHEIEMTHLSRNK